MHTYIWNNAAGLTKMRATNVRYVSFDGNKIVFKDAHEVIIGIIFPAPGESVELETNPPTMLTPTPPPNRKQKR